MLFDVPYAWVGAMWARFFTLYAADTVCRLIHLQKFEVDAPASARWFFVHWLTNLYVAFHTWEDVAQCLADPMCGNAVSTTSSEAFAMATVLHVYHCVQHWSELHPNDRLHHMIFCFGCAPVVYMTAAYKSTAVALFFMCGLPGAIDYFHLWLVKMKVMTAPTQRKGYAVISLFLRSPGVLWACFLEYYGILSETDFSTPRFALLLLAVANAQIYLAMTLRRCLVD